jgi:hypothetical protein
MTHGSPVSRMPSRSGFDRARPRGARSCGRARGGPAAARPLVAPV